MAETNDTAQSASQPREKGATVDIQKLADKVYRLMLADLRLEGKRGASPGRRGGNR
jgi:hypothetical protein